MSSTIKYTSKTQHYLKVKKPELERQRRARINKCLDALKTLIAEFEGKDDILRLDKAEMLEAAITFMRNQATVRSSQPLDQMNSFRNGYMNAVNEVSRVMAAMPGMNVDLGKSVMVHLGGEFNRLLQQTHTTAKQLEEPLALKISCQRPLSPASSGYQSDYEESCSPSPTHKPIWRPFQ